MDCVNKLCFLPNKLIFIQIPSIFISLVKEQFNGFTVIVLTDNTNTTINITLPDARIVEIGNVLYFSLIGGDNIAFQNSVSGQTLDGNNINSPLRKLSPDYPAASPGQFIPASFYGIASDGFMWHSVGNF